MGQNVGRTGTGGGTGRVRREQAGTLSCTDWMEPWAWCPPAPHESRPCNQWVKVLSGVRVLVWGDRLGPAQSLPSPLKSVFLARLNGGHSWGLGAEGHGP